MALVDGTASRLVADVRRKGVFGPSAAAAYPSDADILAFLNEEIDAHIVPLLQGCGEEHFVALSTTTTTAGTAEVALPDRALYEDVRDVLLSVGGVWLPLTRLPPDRVAVGSSVATGQPCAYYMQANTVQLVPAPDSSYSLQIKFFRRPNKLVTTGYTTGSKNTSTSLTLADSTQLGGNGDALTLDLLDSAYPFTPRFDSITGTLATNAVTGLGTSITTLTTAVYVCAQGESPVAQIPYELLPLLTARATAQVCAAQDNASAAKTWFEVAADQAATYKARVSERTKGRPRKVVGGVRRYSGGFIY